MKFFIIVLTLYTISLAELTFVNSNLYVKYPSLHGYIAKEQLPEITKIDPFISRSWALVNIGFFDSFTLLVKPILTTTKPCSPKVIVAVIDTGIDYMHSELVHSLWVNAGEVGNWDAAPKGSVCKTKNCNNVDDDKNGFIDDVIGWDFVHDVSAPYDTIGHGTHISGIIGAAAANGIGGTGVCPGVSIMPLKYYDNSGMGYNNLNNTVRAIQYATKMGAHIINYSGGGADPAFTERNAIKEAQEKGILFIAAAGNEGRNNERVPYYPASYGLDNIISVASINKKNELLPSSNYGKTVNIAAPGMMIMSTLPDDKFGTMTGTSQATAFVTGAAALLASQFDDDPRKHYKEIKQALIDGSKPLKGNELKDILAGGILNIPGALKALKNTIK